MDVAAPCSDAGDPGVVETDAGSTSKMLSWGSASEDVPGLGRNLRVATSSRGNWIKLA